jgi:hypothetical protein
MGKPRGQLPCRARLRKAICDVSRGRQHTLTGAHEGKISASTQAPPPWHDSRIFIRRFFDVSPLARPFPGEFCNAHSCLFRSQTGNAVGTRIVFKSHHLVMTARDNYVEELYNLLSPDLMVLPCQQTESAWSIRRALSTGRKRRYRPGHHAEKGPRKDWWRK